MDVNPERVALRQLVDYVEATFRPLTAEKGLDFVGRRRRRSCRPTLHTDEQRLRQVLRNLLSNAVKFTETGERRAADRAGRSGERAARAGAARADGRVVAFRVTDTGIGIAEQQAAGRSSSAFQQADGTTSRKYGGTGLGPVDQPGDRLAARRRDHRAERTRAGQHVHAVPAGRARSDLERTARAGRRRRTGGAEPPPGRGRRPATRGRPSSTSRSAGCW